MDDLRESWAAANLGGQTGDGSFGEVPGVDLGDFWAGDDLRMDDLGKVTLQHCCCVFYQGLLSLWTQRVRHNGY